MNADPNAIVTLEGPETDRLVETLITCPFVGSAVAQGKLSIRNSASDPLASIEDVRKLGQSGGGDLGDLLVIFASGNHAFMRGDDSKLDKHVPSGLFSLEFPGSRGAHPGHSGILMGDPEAPGSGRLSLEDFARLTNRATEGVIKRSEVARFIAENLSRDGKAKVFTANVVSALGGDLIGFGATIVPALINKLAGSDEKANASAQDLEEKFTKLAGEDNLVGSAGEFGLLFALLANKPGAKEVDGEPTVLVQDLESMFIKKRLPEGSENWKKLKADWIKNTTALAVSAAKEFHNLVRDRDAAGQGRATGTKQS
jgi:hypothetical protein